MSDKIYNMILWVAGITVLVIGFAGAYRIITEPNKKEVIIDTSKTDSMQVFYSKQLDSMRVENQLLQNTITNKDQTIRTLKGLVKENNHYFESITDSALFEELKKVRSVGVR